MALWNDDHRAKARAGPLSPDVKSGSRSIAVAVPPRTPQLGIADVAIIAAHRYSQQKSLPPMGPGHGLATTAPAGGVTVEAPAILTPSSGTLVPESHGGHALAATAGVGGGGGGGGGGGAGPPVAHQNSSGVFSASASRARDVRASITQLAAVVAATKMERRRSVSFGGVDHAPSGGGDSDGPGTENVSSAAIEAQFAGVMAPLEAVDVELLVRLEVAKPENHVTGHGHRHTERVVLTTEAVERASWLFAMAAREFQASAPDGVRRAAQRGWRRCVLT